MTMLAFTAALLLAAAPLPPAHASSHPAAAAAKPLHCRVEAGGASRRCTVNIPSGRAVRPCDAARAAAKQCDKSGKYVVRIVEHNGANCKVSRKRTDWSRTVVASMSKKSMKRKGAACDLFVELR